jgi:hypothetical protein
MQYLLLIHDDEAQWGQFSEDVRNAYMQEYFAYTNDLRSSGALVTASQLQPSATATTVEVRDGETLTTDGPFAETKEQLGGFYLIDVESQEEAIEWAARIPSARSGKIEVRPLVMREAEVEAGRSSR